MPDDDTVVQTAADAAESVVFSRYSRSAVVDLDVTVSFEDGILDVDVYLNAGASSESERQEEAQVTDDAATAARDAVDELFAE